MRKRLRIGLALLLVVVIGGIVWLMIPPREPMYKGKPLSQWLDGYAATPRTVQWEEANEAVRQLGTNSIPTLLQMLRTKDSSLTEKFIALARKQRVIQVKHVPASRRREEGKIGFMMLKTEGRDAVPALVEIYEGDRSDFRSTIVGVIGRIGPGAKKAVPALVRGLGNTNVNERLVCIWALGQIHAEPQRVVPALIKCLGSQNQAIRENAATALGRFGADARPAVPALVGLLNDRDNAVKIMTQLALKQIDFATAAKAGVK